MKHDWKITGAYILLMLVSLTMVYAYLDLAHRQLATEMNVDMLWQFEQSAAGSGWVLPTAVADTNIGVPSKTLSPGDPGYIDMRAATTSKPQLKIYEGSDNYTITFPADDGKEGQVLVWHAGGMLSWEDPDVANLKAAQDAARKLQRAKVLLEDQDAQRIHPGATTSHQGASL